ncbi:FtsQ-type POTRA domain-containing protein [Actinobacteria bacterium YIM 96077]|uniref:POTRA domain-containing protein n=1 Tax=Phytoactinopolyspora halophila TaxID=1981511 RepID=A0A329QW29_9ACTN|nr:FtsQ-type POTRA domain-containing protein [Phytoactinopolyspora halophila]AYY12846.1 FtsQ-type POTRA domain-containing protein [Actinobacteria bacterium YIM 96077]RAW16361.1 hypothetical protein DPM12_06915 [Phytoactinopolyspora halophila]
MTTARSTSAERFAARARRRRIRRFLTVVALVVVLAAAAGATWLVGWSSVLSVRDVRVTGVEGDVVDEVRDTAEVPEGVPLARVDTGDVGERVAELPEVGDVDVHRSWPHSITIEVEPRVPAAAIRDGSSWWSVDEEGVLFGESDSAPENVPVLVAPTEETAQLARATGVAVLTGLPDSIDELVEQVEVESVADVRLLLESGATVRWGTDERTADKARVLLALMDEHEETPSAYDVSAPDSPSVVP